MFYFRFLFCMVRINMPGRQLKSKSPRVTRTTKPKKSTSIPKHKAKKSKSKPRIVSQTLKKTTGALAPYVPIPKRDPQYTSEKIAQIFANQVRTIEGPVSYYILTPTSKLNGLLGYDAPVLILFGDIHNGNGHCVNGCEIKDGCYTFYPPNPTILKFINELGKKIHINMFLEIWRETSQRKRSLSTWGEEWEGEKAAALQLMTNHIMKCFEIKDHVRNRECPATNFYVHMSDTREAKDKLDALIHHEMTEASYWDMQRILRTRFPDLSMKKLLELLRQRLTMGTKSFVQNVARYDPVFYKYSKTMKQLMALPRKLQDILYTKYRYDTHFCKEVPEDDLPPVATTSKDLQKEYEGYQRMLQSDTLQMCYWAGFTSEIDLYFLGRALKKPQGGPVSELSIAYFGDYHVKTLFRFLNEWGLYDIYDLRNISETDKVMEKCVDL